MLCDMSEDAPQKSKPLRSPSIEAIRTLFIGSFLIGSTYAIVDSLLTGRTKFPARFNDTYVTWTTSPGWFVASIIALLLLWALFGYVTLRCWKRFVRALQHQAETGSSLA